MVDMMVEKSLLVHRIGLICVVAFPAFLPLAIPPLLMSCATRISASAPGKVILHGEYAVVFGKKAIAVSVNLRTTAQVSVDPNATSVHLSLKNFNSSHSWTVEALKLSKFTGAIGDEPPDLQLETLAALTPSGLDTSLFQAIRAFLFLYLGLTNKSGSWPAVSVEVVSEFPHGAGLGSSAAFSVALTAALIKAVTGATPDKQRISDWAFQCEHIFHGKPSGIDNSICSFGGAILFQNGQIVDTLTEMQRFPALLVNTNVTRNTKLLVESVTRRRERFPAVIANIMQSIDDISDESWKLMKSGQYAATDKKELVTLNQHLLDALGAGHERIDQVLDIARSRGHAAKLIGAGGGGCVIVHLREDVTDEETDELKTKLTENNFSHWVLSFGGAGVGIESE